MILNIEWSLMSVYYNLIINLVFLSLQEPVYSKFNILELIDVSLDIS